MHIVIVTFYFIVSNMMMLFLGSAYNEDCREACQLSGPNSLLRNVNELVKSIV